MEARAAVVTVLVCAHRVPTAVVCYSVLRQVGARLPPAPARRRVPTSVLLTSASRHVEPPPLPDPADHDPRGPHPQRLLDQPAQLPEELRHRVLELTLTAPPERDGRTHCPTGVAAAAGRRGSPRAWGVGCWS